MKKFAHYLNVFFSIKRGAIQNNLLTKGLLLFLVSFSLQGLRAQISVVDSKTNTSSNAEGIVIDRPSGLAVGDLLIVNIALRGTAQAPTTMSSVWSEVAFYNLGSNGRSAYIAYRVATSDDLNSDNFSFSWGATQTAIAGGITAFRGVNTTDNGGIVTGDPQPGDDHTTPIEPPSISTATNGAMVLFLGQLSSGGIAEFTGNWILGGVNGVSMNNGYTEYNIINSKTEAAVGLGYYIQSIARETGIGYKTISSKARRSGILLALKPLLGLSISGTTDHGTSCLNVAQSPIAYTITNSTSSDVTGISVTSDNGDFVVSNAPTSIPANGSATYNVTFTPSASGARSAVITVASTSPSYSVTSNVSGIGGSPSVTFIEEPGSTAYINQDVTYTTQSGQTNYVWTIPGVLNTDYSITSGGTGSSNSLTLKWLTTGVKSVSVNYTSPNGCSPSSPAFSSNTTVTAAPVGVNRYAVASGSWNSTSIWSDATDGKPGFSVPTIYDKVFIGERLDGRVVTIPTGVNAFCAELNLGSNTTTKDAALNISANSNLIVAGDVNHHRPHRGGFCTLDVGSSVLSVNGNYIFLGEATNTNRIALLRLSTGIINIDDDLLFNSPNLDIDGNSYHANTIEFTGSGVLNLSGQFLISNSGYLIPSTGTFNFNGSSASQTIPIGVSNVRYNNLKINNTHASGATLGAAVRTTDVAGNITVGDINEGSVFNTGNFNVAMVNTKVLTVTASSTMDAGTSMVTFGSTGTATINGLFRTANLNGFNGANASINSSNNPTISLGSNSTVEYYASNVQVLTPRTYSGLMISGGGRKNQSGTTTVSRLLTLNNGHVIVFEGTTMILTKGAAVSGGSVNSFVDGELRKVGDLDNLANPAGFVFPCGDFSATNLTPIYKPLRLSNLNPNKQNVSPNDEYFTVHFHTFDSESNGWVGKIHKKSGKTLKSDMKENTKLFTPYKKDFWDVERPSGSSASVDLTYNWTSDLSNEVTGGMGYNHLNITIGHYDLSDEKWEDAAETNTSGNARRIIAGTLQYGSVTVKNVAKFSPFAPGESTELGIPSAAMPVTLTNFTAKLTPEKKVALSWTTATESVNKGFRIERQVSTTNNKFEQIGFVNSKAVDGNSQVDLYYNFLDHAPKQGTTSFYRLVQEDIDGTLTNSEVRLIRLDGQSVVLVYPNPSNGQVIISRTNDGKKMNVQVFDQIGRLVKQVDNVVDSFYRLFLTQPGIYNIKLVHPDTGAQSTQRIVVHK